MDPDFYHPFPDYGSAVEWLEQRGSFVKDSWVAKTLTPKEVARRVKIERMEDCTIVSVTGYDDKLPDPDIKKAIGDLFSSCGEIVELEFAPRGSPKSYPDRFVRIHILGQGVKDKAEQLNGTDLGGCKLAVMVPVIPASDLTRHRPLGHTLPESVLRQLALEEEANKALHEKEMKRCVEKKMKKEANKARREEEIKRCAQKEMERRNVNELVI